MLSRLLCHGASCAPCCFLRPTAHKAEYEDTIMAVVLLAGAGASCSTRNVTSCAAASLLSFCWPLLVRPSAAPLDVEDQVHLIAVLVKVMVYSGFAFLLLQWCSSSRLRCQLFCSAWSRYGDNETLACI